MNGRYILAGVFVFPLAMAVAYLVGLADGCQSYQKDAISHGCARWIINPVTGEKKFEWNDVKIVEDTDTSTPTK